MFEMLDVATRSSIVLALKNYGEAIDAVCSKLRLSNKIVVGGVTVDAKVEQRNVRRLVEMFTNQFVYVSDEVLDRSKLYQVGAEQQPEFIKLLTELLPLVNSAQVTRCPDHETETDIEATNRMREIVNVLNAGGV